MQTQPQTVGELMSRSRRDAMRTIAIFFALVLYGAVLIFTGIHNYNLFSRTLEADQQLFALVALACLEGSAIFLPIAIHFWLAPGPQRMVGYALYVIEFTVMIANTVLDSSIHTSVTMPEWLKLYATFISPATPVTIGIGIAALFLLDPSKKLHDAEMAASSASIDATALQMREYARGPEVEQRVKHDAALRMNTLLGITPPPELPAGQETIIVTPKPAAQPQPQPAKPNSTTLNAERLTAPTPRRPLRFRHAKTTPPSPLKDLTAGHSTIVIGTSAPSTPLKGTSSNGTLKDPSAASGPKAAPRPRRPK